MTLASSVKSFNASSALTKDFPPTHTTALVPRPAEIQAFPQAGPRRICVLGISLGLLRGFQLSIEGSLVSSHNNVALQL